MACQTLVLGIGAILAATNYSAAQCQLVQLSPPPANQVAIEVDILDAIAVIGNVADGTVGEEAGIVHVFHRDEPGPNQWGHVAALIPAGLSAGDEFGSAVRLADDLLVVGAPLHEGVGAVFVFQRDEADPSVWTEVAMLQSSDAPVNSYFGRSVAISGDLIVVGAPVDDEAAYVFRRDGRESFNWEEVAKLAPLAPSFPFGYSVAVEGGTIVVSARYYLEDPSIAIYIFEATTAEFDEWELAAFFSVPGFGGDTLTDVAIDGGTVLLGIVDDDNEVGEVVVYERNPDHSDWNSTTQLETKEPIHGVGFGLRVALDGDLALIGTWSDERAYVFDRNAGGADQWGQIAALPEVGPELEEAVAIDGTQLLCGGEDAAYFFELELPNDVDCNDNGILDECESSQFLQFISPPLSPIGSLVVTTHSFGPVPPSALDVTITLAASADLSGADELLFLTLNDLDLGIFFLFEPATDCADPPNEIEITLSAEEYNGAIAETGESEFTITSSSSVDSHACDDASYATIALSYQSFSPNDLDHDGVPDECQVPGTPGDLDGDGDVDFSDLLILLNSWGDCAPAPGNDCPADLDSSGTVGFADLLILLANWS